MIDLKNLLEKTQNLMKKPTGEHVPVLGLDVSHHYVRFSQLEPRGDKWVLLSMISRALDPNIVDDAALEMELIKALLDARKEGRFTTDKVAVSLPITSAVVKVVNIPLLNEAELKSAVDNGSLWTSSIQLPDDLSAYSIFWQILARDEAKNQMSLLFVASRKSEIDKMVEMLARAGLDALVVDVRCFALRNILRINEEKNKKSLSAFLEISADENYIIYVDDGMPYIYDIFVSEEDVQLLRHGEFESNSPVFTRISDQVRSSFQSFVTQSGKTTIERVTFVSSLSNASTVLAGLKRSMPDFSMTMSDPFVDLIIPENLKQRVEIEKNKSSFTASLGLATRRLDVFGYFKFVTAVSNINLLPNRDDRLQEQKRKSVLSDTVKRLGVAVAAIGLVALITSMIANFYTGVIDEAQMLSAKEAALTETNKQLQDQLNAINGFVNVRSAHNERYLAVKVLNGLPRTILVKELKLNSDGPSSMLLVSKDPSQFSVFLSILSQNKEVRVPRIETVEVDTSQVGRRDLQVAKITFTLR